MNDRPPFSYREIGQIIEKQRKIPSSRDWVAKGGNATFVLLKGVKNLTLNVILKAGKDLQSSFALPRTGFG